MQELPLHEKVRFLYENRGEAILHNVGIFNIVELLLNGRKDLQLYWFRTAKGDIAGVTSFNVVEPNVVSISTVFKYPGCLARTVEICATDYRGYKYIRTRKGKQRTETLEQFGRLAKVLDKGEYIIYGR